MARREQAYTYTNPNPNPNLSREQVGKLATGFWATRIVCVCASIRISFDLSYHTTHTSTAERRAEKQCIFLFT